jgi:hypothetical protein
MPPAGAEIGLSASAHNERRAEALPTKPGYDAGSPS